MAKLYDKRRPDARSANDAEALTAAIEDFLKTARRPAAMDYGESAAALVPGEYALENRAGRVWIEFQCGSRSISRRVLAIENRSVGALACTVQRFGGKTGRLSFLDLDRPQTACKMLAGARRSFAERFRQMLCRQFPGWEIQGVSSAMDLRRSFSPVFPRAQLARGSHRIAAMACPGAEHEAELLSFALIWFAYVAGRGKTGAQTSLALFLPEQAGNLTAHRLRWLRGSVLRPTLFRYNEHGSAGEVDPRDLGNLETRVSARYIPPRLTEEMRRLLARAAGIEGVGWSPELDGAISIRSRGLEFARIENGRVLVGIGSKQEAAAESIETFAAQLSRLRGQMERSAAAAGPPVFPERWLEQRVRLNLAAIDASLAAEPVHGQVLTFAAGDRDLIDLLAADANGRLAVLELKTSEDVHLPIQALDYWMRVRWHAE
ncbi:MAG: hypothetical protein ACRD4O_10065, partial [Bryobacteraceae bacterium]